jgi:hypothetical protein
MSNSSSEGGTNTVGLRQPQDVKTDNSSTTFRSSKKGSESKVEPIPQEEPFTKQEMEAFEKFSKYISRNPRRVKRIVNIYRLARIITYSDIPPQAAIKWVILTEQWPLRIAWVMQKIEDDIQLQKRISMTSTLTEVYKSVRGFVQDSKSRHLALLDEDPEMFEAFIKEEPFIRVEDIHKLWVLTFNLNPAMQNEVLKSALEVNGRYADKSVTTK